MKWFVEFNFLNLSFFDWNLNVFSAIFNLYYIVVYFITKNMWIIFFFE